MSKPEFSGKYGPIHLPGSQQGLSDARRWSRRSICLLLGLIGFATVYKIFIPVPICNLGWNRSPQSPSTADDDKKSDIHSFGWYDIKPSKDLEFWDCYVLFKCARLQVPMDWNDPKDKKTVEIAVIKLPAPVSIDDKRYGGPVLTNPGGPGGSGVEFLALGGTRLQQMLSSSGSSSSSRDSNRTEVYYDIVSFDPRGVGFSTPTPDCFLNSPSRQSWYLRTLDKGLPGSSNVALEELWALNHAQGASCSSEENAQEIRHHVTTPYVARDMVEIIDKLALWRSKKSAVQAKKPKKVEKLNFWGFSYGTVLGATFAAMYPERVGKLALDGVVDIEDYYATAWKTDLADTEKTMQSFYDTCANAGPGICSLAEEGSSAEDIKETLQNFLKINKHKPVTASVDARTPDIITWSDVKALIFMALYAPPLWPELAQLLADLIAGNGTRAAQALRPMHNVNCGERGILEDAIATTSSAKTILCTDGAPMYNKTIEDAERYLRELEYQSPTGAAVWSAIPIQCTGYTIRSQWNFDGPWGATKTATPILWISNTADPVTPRMSAFKMQRMFPGSRILSIDAPGHCSISGFSLCAITTLRAYFHDDELPPEDNSLMCDSNLDPFLGSKDLTMSFEEETLMRSHRELGEIMERMSVGFGKPVLGRKANFLPLG